MSANEPQTHSHAPPAARPPLVLFDGGCPLCGREIRHYRRLRGADHVEWMDISLPETKMPVDGVDRTTAMARFHVRDKTGHWHSGAFGFAELWSHLAGYRYLARLVRAAGLLPVLDSLYGRFARWRLRDRCDTTTCAGPTDAPPQRTER